MSDRSRQASGSSKRNESSTCPLSLNKRLTRKQGIRPGLMKRTSRLVGPAGEIERRSIAANARELGTLDLAIEHG
jgi:hypothetical protein